MWFEREKSVVAICAQALQQVGPVCRALACRDHAAIGQGIFYMHVVQPGMQRLVCVGIGDLGALNEVCRVEYRSEMLVRAVSHEINTAVDSVAINIFLVFMQKRHVSGTRSLAHQTQAAHDLVAIGACAGADYMWMRGWIE